MCSRRQVSKTNNICEHRHQLLGAMQWELSEEDRENKIETNFESLIQLLCSFQPFSNSPSPTAPNFMETTITPGLWDKCV